MTPLDVDFYDRLKKDYEKHGSLIVATDYDNTINDYHRTGLDCSPIINLLRDCSDLGFAIILFTVTENGHQEARAKFLHCRELGLTSGKFTTNKCLLFDESPKPYYNVLLDDRAGIKQAYDALRKLVDKIKETK